MSGRRSSKCRQNDVASTSHGFDMRCFISQEAEDYYNEKLLDKAVVRERGVANKTLVREFYTNLKFTDQQHHTIIVRGKNINFFARAINSLFGTPSIKTPGELQEFLEDHSPLDTTCELICRDDPQWTLSRLNEPIHFSRTKLTFIADKWLQFVSARLLPTSHTSEVRPLHWNIDEIKSTSSLEKDAL
ncbi:hypothetical protein CDL12_27795 [Handroanthus impetiginosus]|uniref:Putative plant transposon protein domain-containing protein n=1 Tax=Handroanthus impetiginosus TaxID=429701 RepID=A0A2G9G342_9LAMI|nr:hypothetical protein CDL12_27795 [Handroanthus impetiginosus]